jgi:hypothetical protein
MGTMGYAADVASYDEAQKMPSKKKKPWFLKRWVVNWVREDWESARQDQGLVPISKSRNLISTRDDEMIDHEKALRFNVYHANGGRIVEVNNYDRQKDRHKRSLYVITSDQDFGREIDKIITMEALKQ